jgi:hypothetical protein
MIALIGFNKLAFQYNLFCVVMSKSNDMEKQYLYLLRYKEMVLVQYYYTDDPEYTKRWYEEHTCPENFLGKLTEGVLNLETGETDPHGIFKVDFYMEVDEDKKERIDHWMGCGNEYGKQNIEWLIDKIKML